MLYGGVSQFCGNIGNAFVGSQICGMEKLMWGSDYPRTMTAITYLMSLDFVLKSDKLTEEDKRLFLGANAEQFYGFVHQENIQPIRNMVED